MANMRLKHCICTHCTISGIQGSGCGDVLANLDTGTIESYTLPKECKWPAICPERFIRGVLDRPFGEMIARPKIMGPTPAIITFDQAMKKTA